jgi:hypothetical protein
MKNGWKKQENNYGKTDTLKSISQDFIFATDKLMDENFTE